MQTDNDKLRERIHVLENICLSQAKQIRDLGLTINRMLDREAEALSISNDHLKITNDMLEAQLEALRGPQK